MGAPLDDLPRNQLSAIEGLNVDWIQEIASGYPGKERSPLLNWQEKGDTSGFHALFDEPPVHCEPLASTH